MAGYRRNRGGRRFWDEDDEPVPYDAHIGSSNNMVYGTQNASEVKNTGTMRGDGIGNNNQNYFGDVMHNKGYVNHGKQNIGGLINNTGNTQGNGNGSMVFGGFDSSTNNKWF